MSVVVVDIVNLQRIQAKSGYWPCIYCLQQNCIDTAAGKMRVLFLCCSECHQLMKYMAD